MKKPGRTEPCVYCETCGTCLTCDWEDNCYDYQNKAPLPSSEHIRPKEDEDEVVVLVVKVCV